MKKKVVFSNMWAPCAIFLIALLLRAALLYTFSHKPTWEVDGFPKSDARGFDILAMNILNGRGFGSYIAGFKQYSFSSPMYPLFLAFIYSLFGHNYMAVKIAQLFLGSLNAVLVYAIGRKVFNRQVGIISGLIFACYMPHMLWTSPLMRELVATFVFALAYLAVIDATDHPSMRSYIAAGVTIGIAILTRGQALVFVPVLLICGLIGCIRREYFSLRNVIPILLFTFLAISPWIIRSMVIHKGVIILESSSARQFWTAANPKYHGSFYSRGAWHDTLWEKPLESEGEKYKRLNREGVRFIRENPSRYIRHFKKRLEAFWYVEKLQVVSLDLKGIGILLPYVVTFLGLIGAVYALLLHPRSVPLILIILFYSAGSGAFGPLPRYRLPLEQFVIILAAYTLSLISKIRRVDWQRPQPIQSLPPTLSQCVPGSFMTRFKNLARICGALLIVIFAVRLCVSYWGPGETIPEHEVDKRTIQLALEKHELVEEWEKQTPQQLTRQDVFLDQAANGGYVKKYDNYLVMWKGRMEYILRDANSNIKNFQLILDPSPHSFGKGTRWVAPVTGVAINADHFQEGDMVLVIARISSPGQPLLDPRIIFYEILGGSKQLY